MVSPKPLAMILLVTENPRHPTKFEIIKETQIALFDSSIVESQADTSRHIFFDGNTSVFVVKDIFAIDGMNGEHSKMNKLYSQTIRMHTDNISKRILEHAYSVAGDGEKLCISNLIIFF